MTQVPVKFPSYTSYNAKTLLMHVDTLKQCVEELQAKVAALEAAAQPAVAAKKKPEDKNG